MAIYLKEFSTTAEYEEYINGSEAILPNVSICDDTNDVHYKPEPPHDYSQDYFTMVAKGSGDIVFNSITEETSANTLQYSIDGGSTWSTESSSITVSVTSGQKVMFKGTCTPYTPEDECYGIGRFSGTTANFDVEGNIMSLLFGDNFKGQTSLSGKDYAFYYLFNDCTTLTSAKNLSLPATTLATKCYQYMFYGCSSLTTAPELPATTLAQNCYNNMFYGCTSLTTAPELPATTLANRCYYYMFYGCTKLATAPALPATTLADYCYYSMLQGCTSLTTAPTTLPATTLTNYCYYYMFYGCTKLTTAPALPATKLSESCYRGMFQNCTSLIAAPELPATTLTTRCYQNMFSSCTNLNSIKCLATSISATNCTNNWVNGVASSGTFTKASSMTRWTTGASGIPSGWTIVDAA